MQWFLLELEKDPSRLDTLDVLASLFQDTAQRALGVGCIATNRLASACTHVATWLRKTPKRIPANLPALHEGRMLIGNLLQRHGIERVGDPSGAIVYAVDNDVDNCECLARKLEKMGLQARYALKAEIALDELADTPCDLIILDGDLCDWDTLYRRIREIPHHRKTPVLSINSSTNAQDARVANSDSLTFSIEKPYHLYELTLRALCAILAARVGMK
jgi:CheY-like chemotaxis protein